jgi:hypothetical protein
MLTHMPDPIAGFDVNQFELRVVMPKKEILQARFEEFE